MKDCREDSTMGEKVNSLIGDDGGLKDLEKWESNTTAVATSMMLVLIEMKRFVGLIR